VFFILPETKGVSLERMDRLFGEIDFVDAGEQEETKMARERNSVGGGEKQAVQTKSELVSA
jgi:hypothetical protein